MGVGLSPPDHSYARRRNEPGPTLVAFSMWYTGKSRRKESLQTDFAICTAGNRCSYAHDRREPDPPITAVNSSRCHRQHGFSFAAKEGTCKYQSSKHTRQKLWFAGQNSGRCSQLDNMVC